METLRRYSRRTFVTWVGGASAGFYLFGRVPGLSAPVALAQLPGGTLDPTDVTKFVTPLLIPPVMPRADTITQRGGKTVDYYEISMRQFEQQILPANLPKTRVWGYGAIDGDRASAACSSTMLPRSRSRRCGTGRSGSSGSTSSSTGAGITCRTSSRSTRPCTGPTRPAAPCTATCRPEFDETPGAYTGPVPIVTHVHGAVGVADDSDGYAEAWYLPAAGNIPGDYATEGTWYDFFAGKAGGAYGVEWGPGFATFQYPNENRASTIWYHDHALGMTRLNVYAGPAGFYLVRGGPAGDDEVLDTRNGRPASLPGPAPRENDKFPPNKRYREIPIAIQDRSFNLDGSLFYPDTREFFDEIVGDFIPEGEFSPIWNPEFFGNTIMVNGNTWPFLTVERQRYRFRFLNGCQSRFLILDFAQIPGVEVWQIGNEGGFLAAPVNLTADHGNRLLMGPAERADVIVDFTNVPGGSYVLGNVGPDEPFGGGTPGDDFPVSDPDSTGQVMQFNVVPAVDVDDSTPPQFLQLPELTPLPEATLTRPLALIEKMGMGHDADGNEVEGPVEALLGTVKVDGFTEEKLWMDAVSENPAVGATEVWEFYNTTGDAHPMHVHEVVFEVVDREGLVLDENDEVVEPIQLDGEITPPEPGETGFKDTVIAYPGQVTRVKALFDKPGQFVWHCHIVEHEDNEMMRPYRIGPAQPGEPGS